MATIYHTVKDKGNPNEIIKDAPFYASGDDQWFGEGYYFWESYIGNAHWWGDVHCYNSYVICESEYEQNANQCFDLVDNKEHMDMLSILIKELTRLKVIKKDTTLSRILVFAREYGLFPTSFKSIRASIPGSRSYFNKKYGKTIPITDQFRLDLQPQIQLCFFDTSTLRMPMNIVYPEHYIEGYAV